jgi:hypothetical protein
MACTRRDNQIITDFVFALFLSISSLSKSYLMLKQFNPHQSIRIALHHFETSVASLWTDLMAANADLSALGALTVILSMTSLRPLSRCKGLQIATKIQLN